MRKYLDVLVILSVPLVALLGILAGVFVFGTGCC